MINRSAGFSVPGIQRGTNVHPAARASADHSRRRCRIIFERLPSCTSRKAKAVLERMEDTLGLEEVIAIHLNDSIGAIGSRKDRHAHITEGTCGESCFRAVFRVPAWRGIPMVLETEKEGELDGRSWDEVNLERLSSLAPGR